MQGIKISGLNFKPLDEFSEHLIIIIFYNTEPDDTPCIDTRYHKDGTTIKRAASNKCKVDMYACEKETSLDVTMLYSSICGYNALQYSIKVRRI
jgi:hypothetical protein